MDYKNDHVSDVQRLYTGSCIIDHIDDELITEMYKLMVAADQLNAHHSSQRISNPPKRHDRISPYDEEQTVRYVDKIPPLALLLEILNKPALDAILNDRVRLILSPVEPVREKHPSGALKRKKSYRQF